MRNYLAIASATLALAGCVTPADFTLIQAPATTEEALVDIRYSLRDSDAATFRNVRTFAFDGSAGGTVVCGDVNGANAFGGLTGFKPFRASITPSGRVQALYIDELPALVAPCR